MEEKQTVIKPRKCPACGEEVKRYSATGLFMPIEGKVVHFMGEEDGKAEAPILPFGFIQMNELFRICFRSECPNCGLMSLWSISFPEIEEMIKRSAKDVNSTPYLEWHYNPEIIRTLADKITDQALKESLESLLK